MERKHRVDESLENREHRYAIPGFPHNSKLFFGSVTYSHLLCHHTHGVILHQLISIALITTYQSMPKLQKKSHILTLQENHIIVLLNFTRIPRHYLLAFCTPL